MKIMNDSQTLELQLKTTGEETLKVYEKLINTITGLNTTLDKTNKALKDITGSNIGISNIEQSAKKASNAVSSLNSSLTKIISVQGIKRAVAYTKNFLDESVNRAEELNLFNVIFKNIEKNGEKTFSELGKSETRFQNQLNEAFGTNMTETLRYQGLFQAMASNQGIADKYAGIMSETMTKLTYDLASLYNKSEKTTAEALRGGVYAGQTKPLRNFGIDVTQTSLNPILAELGIDDRTVNQMSQAEKQILRYIATLKQARAAMGDFADTIESPANQLKIFRQQLAEMKVAIGNLFMGLYANILPYANAILMVIKEIAKALAEIFGIDTRDYNSGLASTEEIFEDYSKEAGNATKAVKELKRQILSFDQIHNLTTPSNTGSGSGSGLSGGIDQRLLDAIGGYDNLMGKVKMKATEIRDRIMEWLGFTKEINLLTGETSFKFDHITGGTVLGALAVGGAIYTGVKNIYNTISGIFGFLGKKKGKDDEDIVEDVAKKVGKESAKKGIGAKIGSAISAIGYTDLFGAGGGIALGLAEVYDASEKVKAMNTYDYQKSDASKMIESFNTIMGVLTLNPIGLIFNNNTLTDFTAQLMDARNNAIALGEVFDKSIGEKTQKKLTELINQIDAFDNIITSISFTNKIISEDDVTVVKNIAEMIRNTIINELDADKNEELRNLKPLKNALGTKDYEEIRKSIENHYKKQSDIVKEKEKQINDIIAKANKEKRELSVDDLDKINKLREEMLEKGVSSMTESEEEFKKIMIRINHNVEALTLERASFIIKNAQETKEKAIKEAEGQYTNIILQAERMRDAEVINEDAYNKIIESAEKTKNETIQKTNEQYDEISKTIKEKMGDNAQYIDLETGNIKKKIETWNLDVTGGIDSVFNGFSSGLTTTLSNLWTKLTGWTGVKDFKKDTEQNMGDLKTNLEKWKPNIPTPKVSWDSNGSQAKGTLKTVLETLGLPTSLPKLSVKWISAFANGGFPEDGLFFANHNELVGKFSNGKTAVANNDQIIQGIQSGVFNGVMSAMSQSSLGSGEIHFYAHTDEGVVIDRINQKTKQTGVCPINIPA